MLQLALAQNKCLLYRGKLFPNTKADETLREILSDTQRTLLLYPTKEAVPIDTIDINEGPFNIVLIDGTWPQVRNFHLSQPTL